MPTTKIAKKPALTDEEFTRRAQKAAVYLFVVTGIAAVYCLLAILGLVPAAPWSPVGKAS